MKDYELAIMAFTHPLRAFTTLKYANHESIKKIGAAMKMHSVGAENALEHLGIEIEEDPKKKIL